MKKSRNETVKTVVASYLERRNYPDSQGVARSTANSQAAEEMARSAIVETEASCPSSILFSSINSDPAQCDQQFTKLVSFIKSIENETVKNELLGMLCPLLCHLYLEMLRGGHRMPASIFLKKHSTSLPSRDFSFHQPVDGNLPSALYRPNSLEQLFNSLQNGTIDNETPEKDYMYQILDDLGSVYTLQEIESKPLIAAFRSCKFDVQLSQESGNALKIYLGKHGHTIVLQVLQTWFHIDVTNIVVPKQESPEPPEYHQRFEDTTYIEKESPSLCNGHMDFESDSEVQELQEAIKLIRETSIALKLFKIQTPDAHLVCANVDSNSKILYAGFQNSEIRLWGVGKHQIKRRPKSNISKIPIACNVEPDLHSDTVIDYSLGIALRGHSDAVTCAHLMEKEKVLLSTSRDCTLRAWRMTDYSCAAIYRGHNYPIWCLDVMKNGHLMATGSHDRTVKIWSPERTYPMRVFAGHVLDVNCVKFHPNGLYFATGGADRSIRLWCLTIGRQVRVLNGHRGAVYALAFSADGKYLASGGEDKKIKIWDLAGGGCIQEFKSHQSTITCLDWSHSLSADSTSNGLLASASMDSTVRLWDYHSKHQSSSNHDSLRNTFTTKCSHLVNTRLTSDWLVAIGAGS